NDLVRKYLWNAARSAVLHNPAVRALYSRLKGRGVSGSVALGHCMRKLLHLVYAVWRTGVPFDPEYHDWEGPAAAAESEEAAGHSPESPPVRPVVTAAGASIAEGSSASQSKAQSEAGVRGGIDYAWLRDQVSMAAVLGELGWL